MFYISHLRWIYRNVIARPTPYPCVTGQQSVQMYEPQAAELLMTLGLSIAEEASPEDGASGASVVPLEGVQALSAAMSLIGGDSGVSAEVC